VSCPTFPLLAGFGLELTAGFMLLDLVVDDGF